MFQKIFKELNLLKNPNAPCIGELRQIVDPTGLCVWDWPEPDNYSFGYIETFDVLFEGSIILVIKEMNRVSDNKIKTAVKDMLEKLDICKLHDKAYVIADSNFCLRWVAEESLIHSTRNL